MRALLLNSAEAALPTTSASASTLNSALLVRVVNTGASSAIVYRLASVSGTVLGSASVIPYEAVYLFKDPTDVLYAPAPGLQGSSITFMY
mgnify:CR=1 FL=1